MGKVPIFFRYLPDLFFIELLTISSFAYLMTGKWRQKEEKFTLFMTKGGKSETSCLIIIFVIKNGKRKGQKVFWLAFLLNIFMKKKPALIFMFFAILNFAVCLFFSPWVSFSEELFFRKVDEGLWVGEFDSPLKSKIRDSKVTVVKIDPKLWSFKLLCASEYDKVKMTARKWCERFNLAAAINAGMYQVDGFTNVGFMKNFNHINNPRLNNSYKAILAFNPVDASVPEVQIIDLRCQDFERLRPKYQTLVQNIRMMSCRQENVWAQQDKIWSMSVFGMDKGGNALFIFTEAPYSGYDFVNILLSLPISIYNALYLEGGPEASLYFSLNGVKVERVGIYETGFQEDLSRSFAWPIPNVIGITKKLK